MSSKTIWGVHLVGLAAALRDPGITSEIFLDEKYDTEEDAYKRMLALKGAVSVRTNYGFMKINFNNIIGARVVKAIAQIEEEPTVAPKILQFPKNKMLTIN